MKKLLTGNNIIINAINEHDTEFIEVWFNNVGFLRLYDMLPAIPQSVKTTEKMLQELSASENNIVFALRNIDSGRIIGIAGFLDIMWTNGTATFFIGIGDDTQTGKGIGTEAIGLMLEYGFSELNLYRIQLNVIAYNVRAIKAYEKCGFKKEGTYRELICRDGKRHDLYLYGLLRNEWADR